MFDDTLAHVFNDSGYRAAWDRLLPADKAVLRALAQGVSEAGFWLPISTPSSWNRKH